MFNWKKFRDVKTAVEDELTLEKFRSEVLRLMAEENVNHYRLGQLYNRVVTKKLAETAGYKNAQDYVRKELPELAYSSLRSYAAVASNFREEIAVRFGVTCLYLLLIYKEAADMQINHEEPEGTIIEVPGENGAVTAKPFGQCSVDEMRKAIQRKRKPASSKPLPAEDLELAGQYQEAVSSHFPPGVVVKVLPRNEKGATLLDIKGIPVHEVPTLLKALATAIPDELEEEPVATTEPVPPVALAENVAPGRPRREA